MIFFVPKIISRLARTLKIGTGKSFCTRNPKITFKTSKNQLFLSYCTCLAKFGCGTTSKVHLSMVVSLGFLYMNLQHTTALKAQRHYRACVRGANKQSYFAHDVPTDLLATNKQFGCLHYSGQVALTHKIWFNGVCDVMSSTILRSCTCLFSVPFYFYSERKRDS